MSKVFTVTLVVLVSGFFGFVFLKQGSKPKEVIIGVSHSNQGQNHIAEGQKHDPYNSDPASSGPHYNNSQAPAQWGVYTQEIPDEFFLHNEEHGGVVFTYNPKLLPADQLKKLQALFAPPYSNQKFTPSKAIVTPRSKDTHAIEIASWTWTLNLDQYDEATVMKFYLQHVGKSPEPTAGPTNTPINEAAN